MNDRSGLTRRHFLAGAGALGASAAFGVRRADAADAGGGAGGASGVADRLTPTSPSPGGRGTPTLVMVTLYGGNDALNTVVPIGDPRYAALRGSLALDPATVHDIGDGFALHPSLARSKELWDRGQLAAVHGVGFPNLDRSHFHCMDVWQAASEHDMSTGWVGRWLDLVGADPLDAVAVGTNLPLLVRGARRAAAVVPAGPFLLPGDEGFARAAALLGAPDPGTGPLAGLVAASTADLLAVVDRVGPLLSGESQADEADDAPASLGAGLGVVATLIEAALPTRIYCVDLRGFDTHAGQAPTHAALLGQLDAALGTFVDRMTDRPVTVAVFSEFGRRVAPNASDGTDHGGGGTMLLAGHVKAGHHGDSPPLDALVDGDLATTIDFRAVLGGLLGEVLGVDPADVIDAAPTPLTVV